MQITLQAARINSHISQKEAAKELGITPNTLRRYEHGQKQPPVNLVRKMLSLYGCSFDDLIFFE